MKRIGIRIAAFCCLLYGTTEHAVYSSPVSGCGNVIRNFNSPQKGDPVITGAAFTIPSLKLRVTDSKTGKPVSRKEVVVRYVWRWFEYPYPDHAFGVWSDAYDLIECSTDDDGYFLLPEYKLVPRGWYQGQYLLGRKPKFKDLELSVENHHLWMTQKQIENSKKGTKRNNKPVFLSRPDKFVGPFRIEVLPAM